MAVYGGIVMLPVYYSIGYSILFKTLNIITFMVIGSILVPVSIAMGQSVTCAALYIKYLPYFLFLLVFFIVFLPGYSFARLFDTTWVSVCVWSRRHIYIMS